MYNLDLWKTSGHADHYKVRCCCMRAWFTLVYVARRLPRCLPWLSRPSRVYYASSPCEARFGYFVWQAVAWISQTRRLLDCRCASPDRVFNLLAGQHVLAERGEAGVRAEAHELPRPLPYLRQPHPLVPGAPSSAGRLRRPPPERVLRRYITCCDGELIARANGCSALPCWIRTAAVATP